MDQGARPRVLLKISRTCYQMERYVDAKAYYERAATIDPAQVKEWGYLADSSPGGSRAAAAVAEGGESWFIED